MSITIALVDDDRNVLTSLSVTLQTEGLISACYLGGSSNVIRLAAGYDRSHETVRRSQVHDEIPTSQASP